MVLLVERVEDSPHGQELLGDKSGARAAVPPVKVGERHRIPQQVLRDLQTERRIGRGGGGGPQAPDVSQGVVGEAGGEGVDVVADPVGRDGALQLALLGHLADEELGARAAQEELEILLAPEAVQRVLKSKT